MKYIIVSGGLGNQMFMYAFCLELRFKGEKAVLFLSRRKNSKVYGTQGLEMEKIFSILRVEDFPSMILTKSVGLYYQILRLFPREWRPFLLKLIGIYKISVEKSFIYYPEIFSFKHRHEIFSGTWQSELYFKDAGDRIRKDFTFKTELLSEKTLEVSKQMKELNSVSIHIRRGDYLSDRYGGDFSGICTPEYYFNAIDFIKQHINNPFFYVFTDDKNWVNDNFILGNAEYINFNLRNDSWQDMYLMSNCKHNIIANSTFSWWAAWLNSNPSKIVIAPKKWWNSIEINDVVPESWIRI